MIVNFVKVFASNYNIIHYRNLIFYDVYFTFQFTSILLLIQIENRTNYSISILQNFKFITNENFFNFLFSYLSIVIIVIMNIEPSLLIVLNIPARVHCQLCLHTTSWRIYSPRNATSCPAIKKRYKDIRKSATERFCLRLKSYQIIKVQGKINSRHVI